MNKRDWIAGLMRQGWTKRQALKIHADTMWVLHKALAKPNPKPVKLGHIGVIVPEWRPGRTVSQNFDDRKEIVHIGASYRLKLRVFKEFERMASEAWFGSTWG